MLFYRLLFVLLFLINIGLAAHLYFEAQRIAQIDHASGAQSLLVACVAIAIALFCGYNMLRTYR